MITGLLGYEAGKRGLTQTAMNQLTGIRRSKAHQIESYFQSVRSQVRTLGESLMAVDALREFRSEFLKLDGPNVPPKLRATVAEYYSKHYLPGLHKLVKPRAAFDQYMPVGRGAYALQAAFLVNSPFPTGEKEELDSSADVPGYSRVRHVSSIVPQDIRGVRLLRPVPGGHEQRTHRLCGAEGGRLRYKPLCWSI